MALTVSKYIFKGVKIMIFVGIYVAKDKHDCYVVNSDGKVLFDVFTIDNNISDFESLYQKLQSVAVDLSNIKVGLEATGHYSYNILGYLLVLFRYSVQSSDLRHQLIITINTSITQKS